MHKYSLVSMSLPLFVITCLFLLAILVFVNLYPQGFKLHFPDNMIVVVDFNININLFIYFWLHWSSFVVVHRLNCSEAWDLSSPTRQWTHDSCIGMWILITGSPGKSLKMTVKNKTQLSFPLIGFFDSLDQPPALHSHSFLHVTLTLSIINILDSHHLLASNSFLNFELLEGRD